MEISNETIFESNLFIFDVSEVDRKSAQKKKKKLALGIFQIVIEFLR